jgi:hypothetical protein
MWWILFFIAAVTLVLIGSVLVYGRHLKVRKSLRFMGKGFLTFFIIGVVMFLSSHFDIPPHRSNEATDMVRAEFGYGTDIRDSYFITYGFLQGVTCYYRFCASQEDVQTYINTMQLVEIPNNSAALNRFFRGSPYWWRPRRDRLTRFYGFSNKAWRAICPAVCVLSWNQESGVCHIRRVGG